MDIATIVGILSGIGLIFLGIALLTQDFAMFWSAPSLAIVLGGSLAATLIAFPISEVLRVFKVIGIVFRKEKNFMRTRVKDIVEVSRAAKRGKMELEKVVNTIRNPFLKDGVQLIIDGYNENDIRDILSTRIANREQRERDESDMLKTMGKFAPAFGMVGTLIGLVVMLYGMSAGGAEGGDDMAKNLGIGMGAAIVTTFYGTVLANLFFNPMATKLEMRVDKTSLEQYMMLEGVVLLYNRKHPIIVRERLNSFLAPRDWISEDEVMSR
ncbi:MAG: MotA/TolQ/ExbB proton channel family protein [Candidatus Marinimicrobia bacterium]|nr:MotA/TolQ/ExbB proton channel family protein [Candidatus Neomarinimicrobiota bacterium]